MKNLEWRVHTANLLNEILVNDGMAILEKPINIFGKLLAAVGDRATEIDDPKLNKLMIQLTIYSMADPSSPDYNQELVHEYLYNDIQADQIND
jgi:hypothetical protein